MRKIALFLSMSASVMLASCSMESVSRNEPVVNPPVNGGNQENVDTEINLVIPGGFSVMSTRGLTEAQESAVEDAYVLVFSAAGDQLEAMIEVESAKIKVVEEATTLGLQLPEGSHRLVVIANAAALVESELGAGVEDVAEKGYADVVTKLTQEITGKMFASGGVIPMWGETAEAVTVARSSKFDIELMRSIARVDVGVGKFEEGAWDDMDIPFELTEVYMMRPLNAFRVVPDVARLEEDEPSLPEPEPTRFSLDDSEDIFVYTENIADGKYLARNIYVPETPIDGALHTEQMALVVGGKYRDSEDVTYYRLDFKGGEEFVEVLRNHLYRFQISGVVAAGYEYPAAAYNAVGEARMTATVLDWEEVPFDNIEMEGDGYISTDVPRGGVKLSVTADGTKTVNIRTNLYNMELSVGGSVVLTGTAAEAAGATGQTYSNANFKYTLKKVVNSATDWTLETTALLYNIGTSGTARTDEWTITAGGGVLDMDFIVTQPFAVAQAYVPNPAGEVSIDGPMGTLIWSASNVDAPRVFAASATDYGRLYQFASAASPAGTRMVGWTGASNTAALSTMGTNAGIDANGNGVAWNAAYYPSPTWSAVGDWLPEANPCPQGWRIPTQAEWQAFYTGTGGTAASSTFGAVGGINGRTFTVASGPDAGKTIFLPAEGTRNLASGTPYNQGSFADYWSSSVSPNNTTRAYFLNFNNTIIHPASNDEITCVVMSVRCVRNVGGTAAATYAVTANANAGGTASSNASSVAAGQFATVSATPAAGYDFANWSFSGAGAAQALASVSAQDLLKTSLTFTMPAGAVTVTANFEVAPTYIIYWDSASQTMQLGSWEAGPGGAVTQANMLFFQFGSTIGFLNQEALADNTQNFDATDIKFNLTTDTAYTALNGWADWFADAGVTYTAGTHAVDGYVSSAAYHNAANVQTGRGDPCKLVGLTIAQIKAGQIDNGKWRLPTFAELQTEGWAPYTGYGAYPAVNTINTPAGIRNTAGDFYPAAGLRYDEGKTRAVGRNGCFWVSQAYHAGSGRLVSFNSDWVNLGDANGARLGLGVRCVAQ